MLPKHKMLIKKHKANMHFNTTLLNAMEKKKNLISSVVLLMAVWCGAEVN